MTTIKRHEELLKYSLEMLDSTLAKGVLSNPRAIAFATSSGAADLLSILLHKLGKLQIGKVIEHQWFKKLQIGQKKTPLYEEKLGASLDIPEKDLICDLMCSIEEKRTTLAYGNPAESDISYVVVEFKRLKMLVEELTGEKFE